MIDPDALPVPDLGLKCRTCGYPLAGLQSHACPECGQSFQLEDYIPPGGCPPLIADGQEVRGDAETVQLLRAYQIHYVELTEAMPSLFGNAAFLTRGRPPRIGVPREQYLDTVDLLRRWHLNEPLPPPPPHSERVSEWRCPHCDEINPPNFELCWNCGQPDEPSPDAEA